MLSINFHLRSLTEKKPQSIFAVFYVENSRTRIFTNQQITPSDWSKDKQKAKSNDKLNKLLKEQAEFIESYVENIKLKKKRFYKDELQGAFNSHFKIGDNLPKTEGEVVDFVSFIENYIKDRKHIAVGTKKNNNVTRMQLYYCFKLADKKVIKEWKSMTKLQRKANPDFLKATKQIDFDQVNYSLMEQFHKYLLDATFTKTKGGVKTIENYSKNFIAKQIKNLKQFANAGVAAGKIHNLSFQGFDAAYEDADSNNWFAVNSSLRLLHKNL